MGWFAGLVEGRTKTRRAAEDRPANPFRLDPLEPRLLLSAALPVDPTLEERLVPAPSAEVLVVDTSPAAPSIDWDAAGEPRDSSVTNGVTEPVGAVIAVATAEATTDISVSASEPGPSPDPVVVAGGDRSDLRSTLLESVSPRGPPSIADVEHESWLLAESASDALPTGDGVLAESSLVRVAADAVALWKAVLGPDPGADALDGVTFAIAELDGQRLGRTLGTTVFIDSDAAGYGWSVDAAPPAADRIDLLTALAHELGHVLGFGHSADGVMSPVLETGARRLPTLDLGGAVGAESAGALDLTAAIPENGLSVTGVLDGPGEQDRYTFDLPIESRLYFDSQTNSGSIRWTLTGPAGTHVSDRALSNSDANDGFTLLTLPAGAYTLSVRADGDTTGGYQFRLLDLGAAVPLVPGTPVVGTLTPVSETDQYRFEAAAGDRLFFDVQARSGAGSARWRLLDPFSNGVFEGAFNSASSSDQGPLTLARAGTYTLLVEGRVFDTGTGSYTFNVQPVSDEAFGLTVGELVTEAIDEAGERDVYSFALSESTRVYFDSQTNSGSIRWTLSGPAGTHVSDRALSNSDANDGFTLLTLPAGAYTLSVRADGDTTGGYQFRLLDLGAAVPLVPGTPVVGTLTPVSETDQYRFEAAAGDRVFFDVQARSGAGSARWRLLDPFSNGVFEGAFNSASSSDQGPLTLARAGTYTLLVEGRVFDTGTGSYTFNVQPVSDEAFGLTVGELVTEAIDEAGERDVYSFALSESTRVYFDSQTNSGSIRWTLSGPAGTHVSDRALSNSDANDGFTLLTLPAGAYTLSVRADGDTTGGYQFRLLDLGAAVPLVPGTPVVGTLTPVSETDQYRFEAAAGDRVFFDVQARSGAGSARWRLLDPFSNGVFEGAFNSASSSDQGPLTLARAGTYTLLVEGRVFDAGTGDYTFLVEFQGNTPVAPLPTGAPLTLGATVSADLGVAGEQDVYSFTLATAATLYFDSLTNSSALLWSLVGPAGTAVSGRAFTNTDSFDAPSGYPLLNLVAGSYALTVSGATGAYSFRLSDVAAATAITLDAAVSGEFTPASETDLYRFGGAAGDRIFFDVTAAADAGNTFVRLVTPFQGIQVAQGSLTDWGPVTLATTGTYVVLVEAFRANTGTDPYTFAVRRVQDAAPVGLTLGTTVSGALDIPGEQDSYTFSLASASTLYVDALTNNSSLRWFLSGPAGGVVSDRAFTNTDSFDAPSGYPLLNLGAGEYTLTLDGAGDFTGGYSFRVVDTAAAVAIGYDAAVSGEFTPANETDLYRFGGAAGDRIFFDVTAAADAGNTFVRLVTPFQGIQVAQGSLTDWGPVTLATTGTYVVLVEAFRANTGTDPYTFAVRRVQDAAPVGLTLGTTVSGALDIPGEQDSYTFSLASASTLYVDALTNNSSLRWFLSGPAGGVVSDRAFTNTDSFDAPSGYPLLNLGAGEYTLTLDGAGDFTGGYSFRVVDTAAAVAIGYDAAVSGEFTPASETDFYRFGGAAGDRIFFDVTAAADSGNTFVRLVTPFQGIQVAQGSLTDWGPVTLATTGTYVVLVEAFRANTGTDPYTFAVRRVQDAAPVGLTLGTTVSGALDIPGEQDSYTFSLASASTLYVDALTNNSSLRWFLSGPAGGVVSDRAFTNTDSFDAPSGYPLLNLGAGEYTLTLDGAGDFTGGYSFRVVDTAAAVAIGYDAAVSGEFTPASETDLYRFGGAAGDRIFFDVTAAADAGNTFVRLVTPFQGIQVAQGSLTDWGPVTLATTGTYVVLVEAFRANTGTDPYTFAVRRVQDAAPVGLTLGTTVSGALDIPGEQDSYTFSLASASTLYVDALTNNSSLRWFLSGPAGGVVSDRAFTNTDSFDAPSGYPLLNLGAGEYTLTLDGAGDFTGGYSFRVVDTAAAVAIGYDAAVSGEFTPASETDFYRFGGAAGDRIFFDVTAAADSGNTFVRLVTPFQGIQVAQGSLTDWGPVTLGTTGTYVVLVEAFRANTGTDPYTFKVAFQGNTPPPPPPTGAALVLGATVSDSIAVPAETDVYSFTLAESTRVYFDSQTNTGSIRWTLSGPAGTHVSDRALSSSDAVDGFTLLRCRRARTR